MKKTFVIISLVSLVSLASCDLDLYPETGYNEGNVFVPKDTTTSQYTTAAQIESLVKGFYSGVLKNDRMQRLQFMDWLVYSEVRADNAYNGSPSTAELVGIESNKIDGSNQNVSRDWNDFQIAINAANQVICNIDRIQKLDPSMTQAQHDNWLAQADILKAFYVFRGTQLYNTIPVINSIPDPITAENIEEVYPSYYPSRPDREEIYSQIVSMLEFAAQNAPDLSADDKFVLSKTFAKGILAHVYAEKSNVQDWSKVALWCEAVEKDMNVDSGSSESLRASLCESYKDLWSYDKTAKTAAKNTKESIFEVTFTASSGNWLHMMFHRNQFSPMDNYTWSKWITPSRNLINAYDAEGDTERKNVSILWDACTWSLYYPEEEYAFMGKMETNATSIILMRLAEIYLLHAEALAMTGDSAGALKYVNAVRLRAKLPSVSGLAGGLLIDKILDERRLELAFEGFRFFDLVRHDKAIDVHNSVWKDDSYYLTRDPLDQYSIFLPVPTTVLDTNPNIEQNPGY